ncbi:hypothetical protein ACLB90_05880 [Stenotrophomonas sp. LGBM10]|uniref:hypothetical protein n=1 Tax=Stenotrophomonas sp. LGBM10 TaxID=3390038 RepID=UPI00398AF2A4
MFTPSLLLTPLLLSSVLATATAAPTATTPPHVDLIDYPGTQANLEAFHDLHRRLAAGFDDVCADTFCEGAYSDYEAFQLRCSVAVSTGTVSDCRWAFAASELDVDRATGVIQAHQPTWLCRLPIPPGTSVATFFAALEGPKAIFRRLPGADMSIFEALGDCLR